MIDFKHNFDDKDDKMLFQKEQLEANKEQQEKSENEQILKQKQKWKELPWYKKIFRVFGYIIQEIVDFLIW